MAYKILWIEWDGVDIKKQKFFTDGRYTLQAQKELENKFEILDLNKTSISNFIKKRLKKKKFLLILEIFLKSFISELIQTSTKSGNVIVHDSKNS